MLMQSNYLYDIIKENERQYKEVQDKAKRLLDEVPADDFMPTSERAKVQLSQWLREGLTDWEAVAGIFVEDIT